MRIGWKQVAIAGVAAAIMGFAFAWSGIMGIGARSGHWAVTDWFLHWTMKNSVRTASLGTEPPPLDNPEMLKLGAGHYEQGCAFCHGSPAQARSQVVFNMLPVPPDLKLKVPEWTDAELFHIVQDGVRFTGMPAWPSEHREDEVWAMVAFLRQVPRMEAARYRQLAGLAETAEAGEQAELNCQSCHAQERLNGNSLIPNLAGQSEDYLRTSLLAYLKGERASGVMQAAVAGLGADDVGMLARFYSAMEHKPLNAAGTNPRGADIEAGRQLAIKGRSQDRIPACLSCHDRQDANPAYPRLSGQSAPYLAQQLRLFREDHRGGTAFRHLMVPAAKNLTDRDVENLSAYFASETR
ncbi:c-type cytochrome [Rhizobium helianthi]|uniref:C-type cytochrome n=1 Tax=Rhizobium helianthi TaxID=1132695 RepID=A0ABW4M8I1_9HYPH